MTTFDAEVYCDGSGEVKGGSMAYASLVKIHNTVYPLYGYSSNGTSNSAELWAIIESLRFLEGQISFSLAEKASVIVHSDSEITIRGASGIYATNANKSLWASITYFKTIFNITWKHVPRNSNPYNEWCDLLAKPWRKQACDKYPLPAIPEIKND